MRWYERVAEDLAKKGISKAEAGRRLGGLSGQAVGQKLRGERGVTVEELKELSRMAGRTVSEVVGDDVLVIELEDEMEWVELYRLMSPEQRKMLRELAMQMVKAQPE